MGFFWQNCTQTCGTNCKWMSSWLGRTFLSRLARILQLIMISYHSWFIIYRFHVLWFLKLNFHFQYKLFWQLFVNKIFLAFRSFTQMLNKVLITHWVSSSHRYPTNCSWTFWCRLFPNHCGRFRTKQGHIWIFTSLST